MEVLVLDALASVHNLIRVSRVGGTEVNERKIESKYQTNFVVSENVLCSRIIYFVV